MIKKVIASVAVFVLVLGIMITPSMSRAQWSGLGDLFLLDGLFNVGADAYTTLGDLFVLDQLFPPEPEVTPSAAVPLRQQLAGYILIQVEDNGEAWYVNPQDTQRYYLNGPNSAFSVMAQMATGISNADIKAIKDDTAARKQYKGKFWLAVEDNGALFYISPEADYEITYIRTPADAQNLIASEGLGISNTDIEKIPIAPGSLKQ
jgi:hypothetical protein